MDEFKFECQSHPNNKIDFFCTTNQWHFVPLCSLCIAGHTQNHPKGVKVNIENFNNVWEKHTTQKEHAIQLYQK